MERGGGARSHGEAVESLERRARELLARGDVPGGATAVIRAFAPEILRFLRTILRSEDDAGDAFSMFSEGVWRGIEGFRWQSSLRTWAYRIAWNAASTVRASAWRRRGRRLATAEASRLADSLRTRSFARRERQLEELAALVASLPLEEQSLVTLRSGQGLSWAEIAGVFSEEGRAGDEAALARRYSRLKQRLARMAKAHGLLE